jgi:sporulenol synthase
MTVSVMANTWVAAERGARLASHFLRLAQDQDGAWRDFHLMPGRAESWTTAYIAARVSQAQRLWPQLLMDECLRRAARFLSASRQRAGWAYNQRCDPDADTTAQVILFLTEAGEEVPLNDYAALARFQVTDGHFATYKPGVSWSGWGRGHADVTAVAMQAMGRILEPHHSVLQRAEHSLREHIRGAHASESYWWLSRNYLARELLMLGRSYKGAPRMSFGSDNPVHDGSSFDRGLALEVDLLSKGVSSRTQAGMSELLELQLKDGSWPIEPILRLTNPLAVDFDDPLFKKSTAFADDRRTFTTATVLGAIATACNLELGCRRVPKASPSHDGIPDGANG